MTQIQVTTKTVVEVPQDVFEGVVEGLRKIDRLESAMEAMKLISSTEEWLTVDEFLTKTKVSRWTFHAWRDLGILKMNKLGRKWYIHAGEVRRYFEGELTNTKDLKR